MDLKLSVTEPQAEFLALTCKYPLFVGGFGSGKSETMVYQAIIDASHSPDALIALYAPTYDLVKLIVVPRLKEKLTAMGIAFDYNKVENTIITEGSQFGNFILRTLDNPSRIVGYESYRAHIDELDTLREPKAAEVWRKIIARNRQQPKGLDDAFNRVCAYTTPEGFRFAYKRWVKESTAEYDYVQASSLTNPFLPDGYVESLRSSYPGELIEAYLNGQFVNLTSGTVYSKYDRDGNNSNETIKDGETLYIGCDFNVTKQAATVYVRRNGGKEWHAADELHSMYDTPDMIKTIKARYPNSKIVMYPDASGASRKTVNASTSDIALLKQAGFEVRVRNSNPLIKDRVNATNKAFASKQLFINAEKCPTVAECLEQQVWDSNGMPDKKSGNDHQNDATTYPIAYELPIKRPVAHIQTSYLGAA